MTLSQATSIVIVAVIFSVLPMLAVALRFYARSLQPTKLAWDDWLIVPGLVSQGYYWTLDRWLRKSSSRCLLLGSTSLL